MSVIRGLIGLLGLALAALIMIAIAAGGFFEAGNWLMSEPWGQVTLADLYLGFVMIAVMIWLVEDKPLIALFWIVPLPFLGNVWSAIWFVLRLPRLYALLRRS